jgi:hypothetical protein
MFDILLIHSFHYRRNSRTYKPLSCSICNAYCFLNNELHVQQTHIKTDLILKFTKNYNKIWVRDTN